MTAYEVAQTLAVQLAGEINAKSARPDTNVFVETDRERGGWLLVASGTALPSGTIVAHVTVTGEVVAADRLTFTEAQAPGLVSGPSMADRRSARRSVDVRFHDDCIGYCDHVVPCPGAAARLWEQVSL